jgi:hypothetical protein
LDDSDDEVQTSVATSTSVAAPAIVATTTTPLVLPGLPPAAVEALRSPPAGRYVYNCPVFISNSPLAMPSTLQRVLNFEPVDYNLPSVLLEAPNFGSDSPLVIPPESPSHSPLLPYGPTETPPSTSPLLPYGPTSPIPPVAIVMPLTDARDVDILAITNAFEPRVESDFDSEITLSSDSSYTLGTDSSYSGDWVEYKAGTKAGMDLDDPFLDDSDALGPL